MLRWAGGRATLLGFLSCFPFLNFCCQWIRLWWGDQQPNHSHKGCISPYGAVQHNFIQPTDYLHSYVVGYLIVKAQRCTLPQQHIKHLTFAQIVTINILLFSLLHFKHLYMLMNNILNKAKSCFHCSNYKQTLEILRNGLGLSKAKFIFRDWKML